MFFICASLPMSLSMAMRAFAVGGKLGSSVSAVVADLRSGAPKPTACHAVNLR